MKVSVITPAFNSAKTIARCIDSIKSQTYSEIEHIVVDGGSQDGTVEILRQAGVCFISEPDAGIYHAMNKGIRMATGQIIHILNSDDWYSNNDVVARMVQVMESKQLDICHAYVMHMNEVGDDLRLAGSDISYSQLLQRMNVAHPTCFVRSFVYQRFGDFSSGFKMAADYDFLLRVWLRVKVGFLPERTVNMQIGGTSMGNPLKNFKEYLAVWLIHGRSVFSSLVTFAYALVKHYLSMYVRRKEL